MTRLHRLLLPLSIVGCSTSSEGPVGPSGPSTGAVEVTSATQGSTLDPDGYQLTLDGGLAQALEINASLTIADLPAGAHTLRLSGLASNCTLGTPNPLTATVPAGGTARVAFDVGCSAPGALEVTTATSGQELDPDGYAVSVDGGVGLAVPLDGQVTFADLLAGDHSVRLSGLAPNCWVSGSNPLTVPIATGGTHATRFDVRCLAWATLQVATVTTGVNADADGFQLRVDNELTQPLGSNATVTLKLAPGGHTLTLSGVAPNCVVIGGDWRTVTLAPGGTAETTYEVSCTAAGQIVVTTRGSGKSSDPSGYTVSLDGGRGQHIGINGEVTFYVKAGVHSVQLTGLASGCGIWVGGNPRNVTVTSGAVARVDFTVICIP